MNRLFFTLRLRAIIAARRPADLRRLLDDQGLVAFAAALSPRSPRAVADALSMLPSIQRGAVLRHLPTRLRDDLQRLHLCPGPFAPDARRANPMHFSQPTRREQ